MTTDLTISEAARALGLSRRYVRDLVRRNQLPTQLVAGRLRLVPAAALERYQATRRHRKPALPDAEIARRVVAGASRDALAAEYGVARNSIDRAVSRARRAENASGIAARTP